jgi:hypothetical protein
MTGCNVSTHLVGRTRSDCTSLYMLSEGPAWMLELVQLLRCAKLIPQQIRAAPRFSQVAVNFAHWRPCKTNVHNILSPNNPSMCQKEKGVLVKCHVYFLKLSLLKIVGDILSRRSESRSRYIGGPPADSLHCRSFAVGEFACTKKIASTLCRSWSTFCLCIQNIDSIPLDICETNWIRLSPVGSIQFENA